MPKKAIFRKQETKSLADREEKIELPKTIVKRDGRVVSFEIKKIRGEAGSATCRITVTLRDYWVTVIQ